MIRTLSVFCYQDHIDIAYRGMTLARFYINLDTGKPMIRIPNSAQEFINSDNTSVFTELANLDVEIKKLEKEGFFERNKFVEVEFASDGTPSVVKALRAKSPQHENNSDVDSISPQESNLILSKILESIVKNPDQSNSRRAAETRRIAQECNVKPLQVAGVRAALTRGVYGNPQLLIKNKLQQMENNS